MVLHLVFVVQLDPSVRTVWRPIFWSRTGDVSLCAIVHHLLCLLWALANPKYELREFEFEWIMTYIAIPVLRVRPSRLRGCPPHGIGDGQKHLALYAYFRRFD